MQNLSDVENTILGSASAVVVGLSLQPTLYWKNAAQQGMPFTINPRVLYRGLGAAMAAQIGEFAIQYAAIGWVKHRMMGDDGRQLSTTADMFASIAGGAVGAMYTSPVELAMVQQQNFGGNIVTTMKRIVTERGLFGGLSRGFVATVLRDSTYTLGLLGITPLIQDTLVQKHKMNESVAGLAASIVAGSLCGIISCPFDTIKTSMQGDLGGVKFGTFSKTLLAQRKRLFSGVVPRCMNVIGTIAIANEFRVRVGPIMFPDKYPKAAVLDVQ